MAKRITFLVALMGLAGAAQADEDVLDRRMQEIEEQNRKILERLQESERKNEALADEVERLRSRESEMLAHEIEQYLSSSGELEGAEPAGMRTKKEAFVTLYGFLRMDVYYNTARSDNVIIPFRVIAENGVAASTNDNQFAMDPRLTRIGFDFNFGKVMDADATGKLETDFANFPTGSSESRHTPRIRLAYMQIETTGWWLRVGQDWDVASPLFPMVNNETLMWNAGNPGDRRPQVRWFRKGKSLTLDMALGLAGAVNNLDLDAGAPPFTSTERDGFDSGWPNYEIRIAWTSAGERKVIVGLWGFIGGIETDTSFGGETDFLSWMGGLDFTVPIGAKIIVRGEVWFAQAAGDIRANAGQTINTATGEEIDGVGGWAELRFLQNERWNWHVGGTIDDPDENVPVTAAAIERNFAIYAGVIRHFTKSFRTGFDVIYWETLYGDGSLGNMVRFDLYAQFDF
jgi:hypothetical protein